MSYTLPSQYAHWSDGAPVDPSYPTRIFWRVNYSKYTTPGNDWDVQWQAQLDAIRYADQNAKAAKARARLAKVNAPKAKKQKKSKHSRPQIAA